MRANRKNFGGCHAQDALQGTGEAFEKVDQRTSRPSEATWQEKFVVLSGDFDLVPFAAVQELFKRWY